MRLFYFIFLIVGTNSLFAQSQLTEVISSSGGSMNNSSNTIIYSMGYVINGDISNSNNTIAHGILNHSLLVVPTGIRDLAQLQLSVYPNPVVEKLILSTAEPLLDITTIQFWDVNGKMISAKTITNLTDEHEIDMTAFKEGIYLLTVQASNMSKNTYRIIKK